MIRGAIKIAILAFVIYVLVKTVLRYGAHLHYNKHYPGECRIVKGLDFGSEDFQVTKDGLAFITSGVLLPTFSPAYVEFLKSNNIQGNIFLYDFNKPELGARKLKIRPTKDFNVNTFHPHGISLLENEAKGEHLLYVINHPDDSDDLVEKFKYLPTTNELIHLKSFSSDKLHITNDLVVTEEDKFYISDYLYFKSRYLSVLEHLLPLSLGSLLFHNGTDFTVADPRVNSPNGIMLSNDKRFLYVNRPVDSVINVYAIKPDTSLELLQIVDLHALPDNLHLSQSGDILYTGTHPILYKISDHLGDPKNTAPSSVLSIPLKDGKVVPEDITELFYDHGDLISGSSIAAVYNKKLLIGSVINKLVICDVHV